MEPTRRGGEHPDFKQKEIKHEKSKESISERIKDFQTEIEEASSKETLLEKIQSFKRIEVKLEKELVDDSSRLEVAQALKQVRGSLEQLSKITIKTPQVQVKVPIENIGKSTLFEEVYADPFFLESRSNELVLEIDENYEPKDVQAFLDYFNTNQIEITNDNAIPLYLLAAKYEVKPLLETILFFEETYEPKVVQPFLNFFKTKQIKLTSDNAIPLYLLAEKYEVQPLLNAILKNWDCYPSLLDLGIERGDINLICNAVALALKDLDSLGKKIFQNDKNYKHFSNDTILLLSDLKAIAKQKEYLPFDFDPEWRLVSIERFSEHLRLFNNLSRLVPLSVNIKRLESYRIDDFSGTCPLIEHLFMEHSLGLNDARKIIEGFPKLKSYGDLTDFGSIEKMEEYQQSILPIKLNMVLLNDYDLIDGDLEEISKKFEDIKVLLITRKNKITKIPFKNLERIICHNNKGLESLDMNHAHSVQCSSCSSLKKINAEVANTIICYRCPSLEVVNAPHAKRVYITDCNPNINIEVPSDCEIIRDITPVLNRTGHIINY